MKKYWIWIIINIILLALIIGIKIHFYLKPFERVDYYENGQTKEISIQCRRIHSSIHTKRLFYTTSYTCGEFTSYYENGQLKEHGYNNENGDRYGEYVSYYENGQLLEKGDIKVIYNYKDNGDIDSICNDGSFNTYYENGQIEHEIFRKNWCENGTRKHYDKEGNLEWTQVYKNGVRTGTGGVGVFIKTADRPLIFSKYNIEHPKYYPDDCCWG